MNNTEIAEYMRANHPKEDYLLLTLVSCSLLLNRVLEVNEDIGEQHPEIPIINDSMNALRESLEPGEMYIVGIMMDEVDRLQQTVNS